jgi:group I intron endonuclease
MEYNLEDRFKKGIYAIRNKVNGKLYIGKSINIHDRIKQHATLLNNKSKDENRYLINSWFKYGRENFEYFVLEYVEDSPNIEELLKEKELYWIIFHGTTDSKNGYNLRLDSSTNMIVHPETRLKIKESLKKRFTDEKERQKVATFFKKFWVDNPEIKEQMSKNVSIKNTNYSIVQFDRQMNFIKEFDSQKTIRDLHKDLYLPAILQVCNGNKNSYKNCYWRYKDLKTNLIVEQKTGRTVKIKIGMYNVNNHSLLKTFDSMTKAAQFINQKTPQNISKMCKLKTFWKTKPYYFRIIEDIVQP